MKFKANLHLLLLILSSFVPSSILANTLIAGGTVPEKSNLSVALSEYYPGEKNQFVEIATITLDNNLPNYQLDFEFQDRYGSSKAILEMRLEKISGELGIGLSDRLDINSISQNSEGRFSWNPGTQESATVGLQFRVLVRYGEELVETPLLRVSMPHYL